MAIREKKSAIKTVAKIVQDFNEPREIQITKQDKQKKVDQKRTELIERNSVWCL